MHMCLVGLRAQNFLAQKALRLPEFISIKYDNTWREGKNQHVAKWMSWIQHSGIVRQVQDGSGEPGHSHDPQDQRFSIIARLLAQCEGLQTPTDFVVTIRHGLKQIRGRPVFADILPGTWGWVQFFEDLRLNVSGIAASRFSKRSSSSEICQSSTSRRAGSLKSLPCSKTLLGTLMM